MDKVAKITVQKKNKQRYNIFLNDGKKTEYAFSVDEATLIRFMIQKGTILSSEDVEKIIHYETTQTVYTAAIQYLSYRVRSYKEIYTYLKKKEFEDFYIEEAMKRLENEKLIDDFEFAQMYTRTQINTTLKGPARVKRELIEKGIKTTYIEEALKEFTFDNEYERASKLAKRRLRQRQRDSIREKKNHLLQALRVEGIRTDVVTQILNEYIGDDAESHHKAEKEAVLHQIERLYRRQSRKYDGYMLIQKIKEGLYRRGFKGEVIEEAIQSYEPLQK